MMGGISETGSRPAARCLWKDDMEGLLERGGDGSPDNCDASTGLLTTEKDSRSATDGDCRGDWTKSSLA